MRNVSLLLLAAFAFAAEISPLEKALNEGRTLSSGEAASLEDSLQSDPENADARARLLGYYFHLETAGDQATIPAAHASRLRHVEWLIEHHPESEIAAMPQTRMFYQDGGVEYQKQKDLWIQQAQRFPQDARVLKNAANFLISKDAGASLNLMKQAAALQPADEGLSERLGTMMAGLAMSRHSANATVAEQARQDLRGCASVTPAVCKAAATQFSNMVMGRRGTPDFLPADADLAANLLTAAQNLEPANAMWTYRLKQIADPNYRPAAPVALDVNVPGGVRGTVPNPAAPFVPSTIRVGGNVQAANLVSQVAPVYPQLAKQARIQGTVRFNTTIAKDGTIENLQLVSGHPLLVQAAQEAVKQWVYKPTLLNGEPVKVITTIDVNFTLTE